MDQAGARRTGIQVVPVLGEVAAGRPIEACRAEDAVTVPAGLWSGRVFALRVRGTSMLEAGIHDGDFLIVEPRDEVPNGRTAIVELDGAVTVKRLVRDDGGRVLLRPANSEMAPVRVAGETVRVIGVVVGVLRRYGRRAAGSQR